MTRKSIKEAAPQAFAYMPTVFENGIEIDADDPVSAVVNMAGQIHTASGSIRDFIRNNPEEAFDVMLSRFGLVLFMLQEKQLSVFSARQRNKLPKPVVRQVEALFKTWPDTHVGWYSSLHSDPAIISANEAVYGKAPPSKQRSKVGEPASLSPGAKHALRSKFWGSGGFDPDTASDVIDRLLQ